MPDPSGQVAIAEPTPATPVRAPEQRSRMLERFGFFARVLVRLAFRAVHVRPEVIERIRQLSDQGTLIYVMRYRSAVDYLLVNAVLLREGLPLARFAPGVSTWWWRPLGELVRWLVRPHRSSRAAAHAACTALVAAGEPVLPFMRSHPVPTPPPGALAAAPVGPPY